MRIETRALRRVAWGLTALAIVAAILVALAWRAERAAGAADRLGAWACDPGPASVAFKVAPWSNSTALVASDLPEPAAYQVDNDFAHRAWDLWLYPPGRVVTYFWVEAIVEDTQPGGLPAGRINPTGPPAPFYHDSYTKANFVEWDPSGGPGALYRARFPCHYQP